MHRPDEAPVGRSSIWLATSVESSTKYPASAPARRHAHLRWRFRSDRIEHDREDMHDLVGASSSSSPRACFNQVPLGLADVAVAACRSNAIQSFRCCVFFASSASSIVAVHASTRSSGISSSEGSCSRRSTRSRSLRCLAPLRLALRKVRYFASAAASFGGGLRPRSHFSTALITPLEPSQIPSGFWQRCSIAQRSASSYGSGRRKSCPVRSVRWCKRL